MDDLLIPEDFDQTVIPDHPADLGRWMRANGVREDIIDVICENNVTGLDFKTLTDRDMKDIFPRFLMRKRLRDWVKRVMSGEITLKDVDSNYVSEENPGTDHDSSLEILPQFDNVSEEVPSTISLGKRHLPSALLGTRKIARVVTSAKEQESHTLASSSGTVPDDNSIESLASSLKLVVPLSVKECRRKGETITRKARNETISNSLVLLQAAIGKDKPSQSDFELCAQKIIRVVPELKDPIPPVNKSAFKQWATVLLLLKKAFYNRKPVEKPRKPKETSSTQDGHEDQLQREMVAKKPNLSKIRPLLTVSFQKRRWIEGLGGKGTVKRVLEAYPGFKDYNQLMIEVGLVTKCSEYTRAWIELLQRMWPFAVQTSQDFFDQNNLSAEDVEGMDDDDRTAVLMTCLPKAWDIKAAFADTIKENVNVSGYIKRLDRDVHLVLPDGDFDRVQAFIVIDNEILMEVDSYQKALFAFIGVHHAFNLEYPKKLKLCLQFLEEYIFGLPQKKRIAQYRKGVSNLLA